MSLKRLLGVIISISAVYVCAIGQSEKLSNSQIVEMAKAGLGEEVILNKIRSSDSNFDISVKALIELKETGVSDSIISFMIERTKRSGGTNPAQTDSGYSENQPSTEGSQFDNAPVPPKEALRRARTIALVKASLQPSRQALEKELMKRAEWKQFNLSIERYKDNADLYVEIGFVPMSLITHRYVYRIYDRRSGTVIAAGETTSWGSLAENLAKHILKSLAQLAKS